jgi:hypothetical protein
LLVTYVVDEGQMLTYVQNRHLLANGLVVTNLHRLAIANFESQFAGRLRIQQFGPIFGLFLDGNFEASLLLMDKLWDETLADCAPNGFVAAVPVRDVLAFADRASSSGIAELRAVISRLGDKGDHLISKLLFERSASRWLAHADDCGLQE